MALWDSKIEKTITSQDLHMTTDYTPYEGRAVVGWPTTIIVGGRVVAQAGAIVDDTPVVAISTHNRFESGESMTERVAVGNLQVAKVLYDFISAEALPGTGVTAQSFWAGVEKGHHRPLPEEPRAVGPS